MKSLNFFLLVFLVIISANAIKAQDTNHPWEIDLGVNAVVFYPMGNTAKNFKNYIEGFVNPSLHYNYYGTPVRFHIGRYIGKGLSLGLAISANKIRKMEGQIPEQDFFAFNSDLRYDLSGMLGVIKIFKNLDIDPYVSTGVGYAIIGNRHNASINLGGGINFWMGKSNNFGIQAQSIYNKHIKGTANTYFQHSLGVAYRFGDKDTDKDGIKDKEDKCPEIAGLKAFKGCPDTDGDSVIDSEDSCPDIAGLKDLKGCPDKDGDDIADKDDKCPSLAGTKFNSGCPDSDGDGVIDEIDACPKLAGSISNKGCPLPDTDGDGVLDKDDKCIDIAGKASNNGCPAEVMSADTEKRLNDFAASILFNNNHSSFKPGVKSKLDSIVSILKKAKKAKFTMNVYTGGGTPKYNQWLSDRRAKAILRYLVAHGITPDRLSIQGFSVENIVDSNGKTTNQKVEMKVSNKGYLLADADGDGVLNKNDKCIDEVGPASNNGCPDEDISAAVDKQLNQYTSSVLFVKNHSSFKPGVTSKLDAIVSVMKKSNKAKFNMDVYTDGGSAKYNEWLSNRRAKAIVKYLGEHGIASDRINVTGHGGANPYASNMNKGRSSNGWVEIKVANNDSYLLPDIDGDGVLNKDDKCVDEFGSVLNNGCPTKVTSTGIESKLDDFARSILFVKNHSSFKPGVTSKLDAIVTIIKNLNNKRFSIEGYTDSTGTERYNEWLSDRRANAVMRYLVAKGIAANRLMVNGEGEANPIASNMNREGRALNRRAEIKVINN